MARFTLVGRHPLGRTKVRRPRHAELTLVVQLEGFRGHIAGRVVRQGHVRTLGLRGDGGVFSVLGLGESEVVGAVPFGAAGFCNVPQGRTFSGVPSTVCQLLLLARPVI